MILLRKAVLLIVIGILTIVSSNASKAQDISDKNFGIGVMFGEPTGFNIKYRAGDLSAVNMGVAWSLHERGEALHLYSDYLLHAWVDGFNKGTFGFYYGIGGRIVLVSKATVGIRIPLGINYIFEDAPIDIFIEGGPVLDFTPGTIFRGTGVVGIHYYF